MKEKKYYPARSAFCDFAHGWESGEKENEAETARRPYRHVVAIVQLAASNVGPSQPSTYFGRASTMSIMRCR